MMELKGKRALVCGASQGIGEAVAFELAKSGCEVVSLARTESKLRELTSQLPGQGHSYLSLDITRREELKESVASLIKEKPIEILICNTGGPKAGPIAEAKEQEFISAFENHVLVNSLLVQTLLPGMKQKKFGRIINIISTSVKIPIPNLGVSNTIRAAVASWAKTLSLEVGAFGVTVNNVLPGYTETPRLEALIKGASQKENKTEEQVREMWKATIPLRRFATPQETAFAVAFLASPKASYITGINLPVDGGRTGTL